MGSCPIVFKVCTGSKDVTITAPANDVEFFEHLDCLDVREEYVAGDLKVTFIDYMLLTNIFLHFAGSKHIKEAAQYREQSSTCCHSMQQLPGCIIQLQGSSAPLSCSSQPVKVIVNVMELSLSRKPFLTFTLFACSEQCATDNVSDAGRCADFFFFAFQTSFYLDQYFYYLRQTPGTCC